MWFARPHGEEHLPEAKPLGQPHAVARRSRGFNFANSRITGVGFRAPCADCGIRPGVGVSTRHAQKASAVACPPSLMPVATRWVAGHLTISSVCALVSKYLLDTGGPS